MGPALASHSRWHIGAKDLRGALTAYAKRFDLLEVAATIGPHGEPAPALATLRRWRKQVQPSFDFAVVAGPALSRVKGGEVAEREIEAARAAMDALQARCFVLRTPTEVTPTSLWRERIAKVIARVPRDVTSFVWEPSGVWDVEDAAVQARAWGVVLAVDPMHDPVPPGPVAYLRLRALGETRSFGPAALERVVEAVGERREVYAVIETDTALVEGKRLKQIARSARAGALGGGGRLVRPRGAIVVRDDEQE